MQEETYDLAIVGCGPAGMSAAVNARIRNQNFVIVGGPKCSENLTKAPQVDNYLGLPEIKGEELQRRFLDHLARMSIQIKNSRVTNVYARSKDFALVTKEQIYLAKSVILCTGVAPHDLIPGESEFIGKGAGYCATCDGPLYRNKDVAVIAYDQEAEEEARYLAGICHTVYFLPQYHNVGTLDANIKLIQGKPTAITGNEVVTGVKLPDQTLTVNGVFVLRATLPAEKLLEGVETKENTIVVNREMATNITGVFAAGDCTGKPYQLAKAVGEGATAALSAVKYLESLK